MPGEVLPILPHYIVECFLIYLIPDVIRQESDIPSWPIQPHELGSAIDLPNNFLLLNVVEVNYGVPRIFNRNLFVFSEAWNLNLIAAPWKWVLIYNISLQQKGGKYDVFRQISIRWVGKSFDQNRIW